MGCAVNGPGEAKGAHIGIAAGRNMGALYRDGELVRKLKEEEIIPVLLEEIDRWAADYKAAHPGDSESGLMQESEPALLYAGGSVKAIRADDAN
jgi:hypothetical protein